MQVVKQAFGCQVEDVIVIQRHTLQSCVQSRAVRTVSLLPNLMGS